MAIIELVLRIVAFGLGLAIVVRTVLGAIRTFVLPRGSNDGLTRLVFTVVRWCFDRSAGPSQPYLRRDRIHAYYAPIALVVLPAFWLLLVWLGYALSFWAIGTGSPGEELRLSGSSLLTLGSVTSGVPLATALELSEAAVGLLLLALLISYLPTIYSAFSRRELLVNMLEVRADSPPSAVVLLTRFQRLHGLDALHEQWVQWEQWFSELEETHSSLPVLVFYRSQQPSHSWVNAAGAVMDSAALTRAAVDIPMDVQADLAIRAGYLALRRIADAFDIRYEPNPRPDGPISLGREQFDRALDVLASAGVPLRADHDQAWRDFRGWRVNYDTVLRALERLTMAPQAWWDLPMASAYVTDEPELREEAKLIL
ncbi:MAG TPA: hypothetical protein VFW92_03540 [Candidatus Limnocylindrales bacterium]|nr:hypothetical protein [Candidatus Limnocylindrales bacterium]